MVQRTLWYLKDGRRIEMPQAELQVRVEPLVILGEAGMGKTYLLEWLATLPEHSRCTARQLITRGDPRSLIGGASVLVIDALDEVSAQRDGDAVDLVLRQLSKLDFPRFVLSCRVADWRSATGVEAIREQYDGLPLELHLQPFNEDEAAAFLAIKLGLAEAKVVIDHFNARGLGELLGNPQTLNLIADVAESGRLPSTRSQLYERAVEVLHVEHRDEKAGRQLAQSAVLGAAGAAFAAMILTGNEAISRKALANLAEGELALVDIAELPNGRDVPLVLGTRLFRAEGSERFSYLHRRVGEYLGARWLASTARTKRLRRRLLQVFHRYGLVPASLRGIHAWLARDPALAEAVIAADPMGLIEYGDADDLTVEQARWLIKSLERLAAVHPSFRGWGPYSVRGIARPELIGDIRRLMLDGGTPFGLRLLVLEAIKGGEVALTLMRELRALVLDTREIYAHRNAAGEALLGLMSADDWPAVMSELSAHGDDQSVRLAIELMDEVGYDVFADSLIVDLVISHAEVDSRTVGMLSNLKLGLPDERLSGVLGLLAKALPGVDSVSERAGAHELSDFVYYLIVRRLEKGGVSASDLWSWIKPLDDSYGYHRDSRQRLGVFISGDELLRKQLLRLVLLDEPGDETPWHRFWPLMRSLPGLVITERDVIGLLEAFAPEEVGSERWRDVVRLVRHDGEQGRDVRTAAASIAGEDAELLDWITALATPVVPDWLIEEEARKHKRRQERERNRDEHREYYVANITRVRAGEFGAIIKLAKAYLKLFSDIGNELPAHERVADWLGEDIWLAAREGFEAFLALEPPKPTAAEVVESFLVDKHWEAGYILVAALAERARTGKGFADLPDERLMAGFYELRVSPVHKHAGLNGVADAMEMAIRARGVWPKGVRDFIEPQLEAKRDRVNGLSMLMDADVDAELSVELASEWLRRFADLPNAPELELVLRLLNAGRFGELRLAASIRGSVDDPERRLSWTAISLVLDFDAATQRLMGVAIDRDLLWHLRRFTGGRRDEEYTASLSPAQLEWIIGTFRSLWPRAGFPDQGAVGGENAWDASQYLVRMVNRLGSDTSDDAANALGRLKRTAPDGYTEHIQSVVAENSQLRVEAHYIAPSIDAIAAIANDQPPASVGDLQATMLDELSVVQAKVASDDVESWRGFFNDAGEPFDEERCRDHLLSLLRQGSEGIDLVPEAHVGGDKEVDITCAVGSIRMPIEVKGQWHADLWHAADTQLARLYAGDWRAEKRGIYLVLWFGDQSRKSKRLASPGRGVARPQTAAELRAALISRSRAAQEGRVEVVVLDVGRR